MIHRKVTEVPLAGAHSMGFFTGIFLLLSSRSNIREFSDKVTSSFSNNFKNFVLDSLVGYFHIV